MSIVIKSNELNTLVYKYLLEAGNFVCYRRAHSYRLHNVQRSQTVIPLAIIQIRHKERPPLIFALKGFNPEPNLIPRQFRIYLIKTQGVHQ